MAYANLPQWAFLHRWRALPETFVHFLMFIDTFKSFSLTFYICSSFVRDTNSINKCSAQRSMTSAQVPKAIQDLTQLHFSRQSLQQKTPKNPSCCINKPLIIPSYLVVGNLSTGIPSIFDIWAHTYFNFTASMNSWRRIIFTCLWTIYIQYKHVGIKITVFKILE